MVLLDILITTETWHINTTCWFLCTVVLLRDRQNEQTKAVWNRTSSVVGTQSGRQKTITDCASLYKLAQQSSDLCVCGKINRNVPHHLYAHYFEIVYFLIFTEKIQTCSKPPEVARARINQQDLQDVYAVDSDVQYLCDNGYTVEGKDTIFCSPAGWSAPPTCSK